MGTEAKNKGLTIASTRGCLECLQRKGLRAEMDNESIKQREAAQSRVQNRAPRATEYGFKF